MGEARPLYKTDELARCKERCARYKNALAHERKLRAEAEENTQKFHVMLIAARVALIREQKKGTE